MWAREGKNLNDLLRAGMLVFQNPKWVIFFENCVAFSEYMSFNLLLIAWIGEEEPVLLTVAVGVVVPSSL